MNITLVSFANKGGDYEKNYHCSFICHYRRKYELRKRKYSKWIVPTSGNEWRK